MILNSQFLSIKIVTCLIVLGCAKSSFAFCGFYVGKASSKLYNKASQVIMVREGNRTVISMMNDYQGPMKKFAMVVPVPTVLQKGQINVGQRKSFDRIDAFTAPRLVEYFDPDPCQIRLQFDMVKSAAPSSSVTSKQRGRVKRKKDLGVTIEAKYAIGEYEILILSAKESDGLETWLRQEKYHIPVGASQALKPYIKQKMKFFVAKVDLKKQLKLGLNQLRPLQFAFETEKFMLPIRLGMLNAQGPQELLIYVLTKTGRVETTNYRTMKLPTGMQIPLYVKGQFGEFYKAMFTEQVRREGMRTIFTEYFWDMGWCDPCAADPLSKLELKQLGVFWLDDTGGAQSQPTGSRNRSRRFLPKGGAQPVKVTRLHVRYTKDQFPEDLHFQETKDRKNFQGRYVLQHPWKGNANQCPQAKSYLQALVGRQEARAKQLATLTGWEINKIRREMKLSPNGGNADKTKTKDNKKKWWDSLW